MIQQISINPYQIQGYSQLTVDIPPYTAFPLLGIDADSYIVRGIIQTGIDFDINGGCHCILLGKGCSLADEITFMIDLNHDYHSVLQGANTFLKGVKDKSKSKIKRKGSIIIQNDVWIGHSATIMAGVTLHNGCVVAAGSVVTKDVPPYAVVGGNPAKILKYRFDEVTVDGLQKIACWDWPQEVQLQRKDDFSLPAANFIKKYLPEAITVINNKMGNSELPPKERTQFLFFADMSASYPLYPKVIDEFCKMQSEDAELIICLTTENSTQENLSLLETFLNEYNDYDCYITIETDISSNEEIWFRFADYYITTREAGTVKRTCLCDRYDTKILYGTDYPVFHLNGVE